jgi:hypothetical protein
LTSATRRTWWQVIVAAIAIATIACLALVAGAVVFFYRHVRSEPVSAETAESRIAAAREHFAGQQPLLRIDADGEAVVTGRPDAGGSHRLSTLRVLIYDHTDGELGDVSIPFWLLRLAPEGRISLDSASGIDFDAERLNLNVSALDALGPGLLLDHADANGTKLLVWTE